MSQPRPVVAPPGPWAFPLPQEALLDNGIRLLTYDVPGQYVVSVRVAIPLSLTSEPRELEGIATMMSRLLDEGTARHSSQEFAELMERKGIGLGAGMTESALVVEMDVAGRHLAEALDLLRQLLSEPAFPEAEVRRVLAARRSEIEQERASAPHRAAREWISTYYDPQDRASRPTAGTPATIEAITRAALVDFHARHVGPAGATVVVGGDLTGLDVAREVGEQLGTWTAPLHQVAPAPHQAAVAGNAARVVLVDRPGSVQSEFMVGWSGPDRRTPAGWAAYQVLSYLIGGSPTARIDAVLREEKGYTYGIRSAFRPRRVGGTFVATGSVRSEVTAAALGELVGILNGAATGYTAEETKGGVDFISQTAPGRYATADAVAGEAVTLAIEGLPLEFTTTNLDRMRALTPANLEAAAAAYLRGQWCIVVVGDATTWADDVRALGLGEVTVVPA